MASESKFAIIGLGRVGSSIAKKLVERGAEVLCIDNDNEKLDTVRELSVDTVIMDSTNKELLLSQDIQNMDAVVVSIGENFQALLMTTFILKELNVKRIIARAQSGLQKNILQKIGVTEILCPEEEVGDTIAEKLLNPKVLEYIDLGGGYEIVEINVPKRYENYSIIETNIRKKYNLNIITILRKNEKGEKITLGVPTTDTKILNGDRLLLFGTNHNIDKFMKVNE